MSKSRIDFGALGETISTEYLERNGYKILGRNFRYGRLGEIDIIARENEYFCFIEVKTRSSSLYGAPSESVTKRKQQKIIKLAYIYMSRHKLVDCNVRFDIVEVMFDSQRCYTVNLIRNAFGQ